MEARRAITPGLPVTPSWAGSPKDSSRNRVVRRRTRHPERRHQAMSVQMATARAVAAATQPGFTRLPAVHDGTSPPGGAPVYRLVTIMSLGPADAPAHRGRPGRDDGQAGPGVRWVAGDGH